MLPKILIPFVNRLCAIEQKLGIPPPSLNEQSYTIGVDQAQPGSERTMHFACNPVPSTAELDQADRTLASVGPVRFAGIQLDEQLRQHRDRHANAQSIGIPTLGRPVSAPTTKEQRQPVCVLLNDQVFEVPLAVAAELTHLRSKISALDETLGQVEQKRLEANEENRGLRGKLEACETELKFLKDDRGLVIQRLHDMRGGETRLIDVLEQVLAERAKLRNDLAQASITRDDLRRDLRGIQHHVNKVCG